MPLPAQNTESRTNRENLCFIHKADPAKLLHGMDHGFVFQTANAIGPESLDTGYILHNAADILRTNIVLLFSIFRYLPEGKP